MNQGIRIAIDQVMPAALQTGLFESATVSIETPDPTALTGAGFPTGVFLPVAGLQDLQGMIAPTSVDRLNDTTFKNVQEQVASNASHVLLGGFYPEAEAAWRNGGRAIINGQLYENTDILAVESDSQEIMTRMLVRVVTL